MARILDILEEFLHEMQEDNPYKLIGKGGTILSLFYLNRHRESEDLDFDTTLKKESYKGIELYFVRILDRLKNKGTIKSYRKGKSGLAQTNRYHMNLVIETHKEFHTKIDVDFTSPSKSLKKKGKLFYYTVERMFISKLIAFADRKEFKDIYDIAHMIPLLELSVFKGNQNARNLIDDSARLINKDELIIQYRRAFRNAELRFKSLKEPEISRFADKLARDLRILKNKI